MDVIIDANELIGIVIGVARKRVTKRRDIFFSDAVSLYAPAVVCEEVRNHVSDMCDRTGLSREEIASLLETIATTVEPVPDDVYAPYLESVRSLAPHTKDVMYFAAALATSRPIWSEERDFKKQDTVSVFTTDELHAAVSSS